MFVPRNVAVEVTVAGTVTALLNCEVAERPSEEVAVTIWPAGTVALIVTVKVALPLASVVTFAAPM